MRVNLLIAEKAGVRALERARYFPRQPLQDSILLRVNCRFVAPACEGTPSGAVRNWDWKALQEGRIHSAWLHAFRALTDTCATTEWGRTSSTFHEGAELLPTTGAGDTPKGGANAIF